METVETPPTLDSFTPLDEHQSQTPDTFFGGTPVLHLHCSDVKVLVSRKSLGEYSLLQSLLPSQDQSQRQEQDSDEEVVISGVELWVSSKLVAQIAHYEHITDFRLGT
jgi:chloride channel, nucleotide-sensitive, 1A